MLHDFFDLLQVESELSGYNSYFFCSEMSSVDMKEPECIKRMCHHSNETLFGQVRF